MELARNMELGDEKDSEPDTPITVDDSFDNCEIRQNLANVIRKYSNLTRDLGIFIKKLETETAFSQNDPVYTVHCERYIQYSPCTKLSCLVPFFKFNLIQIRERILIRTMKVSLLPQIKKITKRKSLTKIVVITSLLILLIDFKP
ncbi:hypothetical protein NPIL_519061 [Nephila pilipes]|uniref:Uncharacterized protein n=1 Tax=Nephila pilipes TaxID=299642 RepID=A0A8X6U9B4_NEPPI|nr:hypothetical protein NPIL_519061 [Nephila pilipes]